MLQLVARIDTRIALDMTMVWKVWKRPTLQKTKHHEYVERQKAQGVQRHVENI
jgi:hypothetical protein